MFETLLSILTAFCLETYPLHQALSLSVFKGLLFSRLLQILQLPTFFPSSAFSFFHCSSYTSQSVPLLWSWLCFPFLWWGTVRVTRAVHCSWDAGEPRVLVVTQQHVLFMCLSFSNIGKMLLAFWNVLSGTRAFMEQPDSPKSWLLRPSQGTSFLLWNWDLLFFIQCMHHFIYMEFHLPFYYQLLRVIKPFCHSSWLLVFLALHITVRILGHIPLTSLLCFTQCPGPAQVSASLPVKLHWDLPPLQEMTVYSYSLLSFTQLFICRDSSFSLVAFQCPCKKPLMREAHRP